MEAAAALQLLSKVFFSSKDCKCTGREDLLLEIDPTAVHNVMMNYLTPRISKEGLKSDAGMYRSLFWAAEVCQAIHICLYTASKPLFHLSAGFSAQVVRANRAVIRYSCWAHVISRLRPVLTRRLAVSGAPRPARELALVM